MDRARTALSSCPEFIASLENHWRRVMPNASPSDALNCSDDAWRRIAICRRPRPDHFIEDVRNIALSANVDDRRLQHFIVTSLTVERFRDAPPDIRQVPLDLLAAREKDDSDR